MENLRSKTLHKVLIISLKVIPMICALCYLHNTVLSYLGKDLYIFSYLGGMSVLPWLFLLLASIVFKFCAYHRMFLYYILACDGISYYDFFVGIPLEDKGLFQLNMTIACVFLFIILYLYVKHHKKSVG